MRERLSETACRIFDRNEWIAVGVLAVVAVVLWGWVLLAG